MEVVFVMKRTSKTITKKEDIDFILNLKAEDIGQNLLMDIFGTFEENKQRFSPYDIITIPAGAYGNGKTNTKPFTTTVGRFIFNRCFIEYPKTIFDNVGYYNESINKKNYGKLMDKLGYWLLEDKISIEDYKYFCNMGQEFMPLVNILSPGFSEKMLLCSK